jgi:hypothetical protein
MSTFLKIVLQNEYLLVLIDLQQKSPANLTSTANDYNKKNHVFAATTSISVK